MTSKEIIQRIVAHKESPRFGFDFLSLSDFDGVSSRRCIHMPENPYDNWGNYPELKQLTGFRGETRRDFFGNIYGRFNGKTKGECIRGAIQDWEDYTFPLPETDPTYRDTLLAMNLGANEKYVLSWGTSLFSTLRDARLINNALADTVECPECVAEFVDRIADYEVSVVKSIAGCGIDGWIIADDLSTQTAPFMSPRSFRELFKPAYRKLADAVHEAGMQMFLHSCGNNTLLLDDLIDAGMDVFQFDQPDVYPTELLATKYAEKAAFYSPVDIQKVLTTGNRKLIEDRALEMCRLFRAAGGGWIAKDYPSFGDIGVDPVWAGWAQEVIVNHCTL